MGDLSSWGWQVGPSAKPAPKGKYLDFDVSATKEFLDSFLLMLTKLRATLVTGAQILASFSRFFLHLPQSLWF